MSKFVYYFSKKSRLKKIKFSLNITLISVLLRIIGILAIFGKCIDNFDTRQVS